MIAQNLIIAVQSGVHLQSMSAMLDAMITEVKQRLRPVLASLPKCFTCGLRQEHLQ